MKSNPEVERISEEIKIKAREQLLSLLDFQKENSSFIELEPRFKCRN